MASKRSPHLVAALFLRYFRSNFNQSQCSVTMLRTSHMTTSARPKSSRKTGTLSIRGLACDFETV